MVIAVYTDFKAYQFSEEDLYFVKSFINNLISKYQHHQFYLIGSGIIEEFETVASGVFIVPVQTKTGLLSKIGLNKKIVKAIKKAKAEVLISIDTVVKVPVPQLLLISNSQKKYRFPFKRIHELKSIFVLSEYTKTQLIDQYKIDVQKIKLVYGGAAKNFAPISDEDKTCIKEKYTDGKEYFIYRGSIRSQNELIPLLKGFSLFKKRQKSTMKVVLMGKIQWPDNDFDKLIGTYKYREDVVIAGDVNEADQAKLVAAAYAFLQLNSTNLLFVFDAIQCRVPVLTNHGSLFKTIAPHAALFFDSANEADIADKMMRVYKDEALSGQLINNSNDLLKDYRWEETIDLIWQNIA